MKLLLIEDDQTTLEYLEKGFREHGYNCDTASTGPDGLHLAVTGRYDALVLDRMLPQMDGLTLLSALRATGDTTPILLLSALAHVDERIKGLQSGGDDYLAKPFSFQELLLRIELLINRHRPDVKPAGILSLADLQMDLIAHKVTRGGKEILLQPKEFQLLRYLLEHSGQLVSRTKLFEAVWDYHFDPKTNVIDVHIANLRKKIEAGGLPPLIQTIRGAGYMMREIA
jgi:two-component system OmpR family response regulator